MWARRSGIVWCISVWQGSRCLTRVRCQRLRVILDAKGSTTYRWGHRRPPKSKPNPKCWWGPQWCQSSPFYFGHCTWWQPGRRRQISVRTGRQWNAKCRQRWTSWRRRHISTCAPVMAGSDQNSKGQVRQGPRRKFLALPVQTCTCPRPLEVSCIAEASPPLLLLSYSLVQCCLDFVWRRGARRVGSSGLFEIFSGHSASPWKSHNKISDYF